MQSGKRLTLKDLYFAKHTRQNAKLTGPDQGFLVSRLVLTLKHWERGWAKL
jgi:hypothetical protein